MSKIEITVKPEDSALERARHIARAIDQGTTLPVSTPGLFFSSWKQLFSEITEKRLELIRYVSTHPSLNIRQLSECLKRDYKNVHTDVVALTELGLLTRENGVQSVYDQLIIKVDMAEAA